MMCLSDANESFLCSLVSLFSFSFSSSLHLPTWSVREPAEREFSPLVIKLPQGDSKGKTRMTLLISVFLAIWWMEVFRRPDCFCWTDHLSGSQLGTGVFGRWCKGWKRCRWSCWDGNVCVFVYVGLCAVCTYSPLCLHGWCKWTVRVKESPIRCTAWAWLIALWAIALLRWDW